MARKFSVTMPSTSVSTAQDLIRVTVPTGYMIRVLHASAGTMTSETADETAFGLYYASDNGTGTATNVVGLDGWSSQTDWAAAGGVACVVNLTVATTKLPTQPVVYETADVSFGWSWEAEEGIDMMNAPAGNRIVLRMDSPITATPITARLVFELV